MSLLELAFVPVGVGLVGLPGEDPVERLERQIASAKRKGERTEVMGGLKRFLESPGKGKRRKSRAGARKAYGNA